MKERDKEYYNKKIGELYAVIENQEKIIRDLQEKIILLKAAEPMLELTKEYGEKDLYKQRIDKAIEYIENETYEYDFTSKLQDFKNTYIGRYLLEILKGGNNEKKNR